MKKYILIAMLCVGFFSATAQSGIASWKMYDFEKYIQENEESLLLINFWATFCKPCIAEIPGFLEVADAYKEQSVKLLLVSLDMPSFYPDKIQNFATKLGINAPIVWLNETDADYFCPKVDSSWTGSIPATLIINKKTGFRKFVEAEMEKAELEKWVKKALEN